MYQQEWIQIEEGDKIENNDRFQTTTHFIAQIVLLAEKEADRTTITRVNKGVQWDFLVMG